MKKFTKFEVAAMKRTAANVDQFVRRRNTLMAKKTEIDNELSIIEASIDAADAPTRAMTGGYGSEQLFTKEITDTGKVDKNGTPIKTTKFVPKYPETIIPVEEETCDCTICDADVVCEESVEVEL
jgi:hypothetical protein